MIRRKKAVIDESVMVSSSTVSCIFKVFFQTGVGTGASGYFRGLRVVLLEAEFVLLLLPPPTSVGGTTPSLTITRSGDFLVEGGSDTTGFEL